MMMMIRRGVRIFRNSGARHSVTNAAVPRKTDFDTIEYRNNAEYVLKVIDKKLAELAIERAETMHEIRYIKEAYCSYLDIYLRNPRVIRKKEDHNY